MRTMHREIETFELNSTYYEESWINGNKTHVKEELKELFKLYPYIFVKILFDINKNLQSEVINYIGKR